MAPTNPSSAGSVVKLLSREDILSAPDIPSEVVQVPEWGGAVMVRGMTGTQRDAFEAGLLIEEGSGKKAKRRMNLENVRARLAAACIVDVEGNTLFTVFDVAELGRKSATALQRVYEVAQRLSGLTDEDVEELVGNSEAAQSGASTSV